MKQLYIHVVKIESGRQQADFFTKGLPTEKCTNVRKQLMGWHSSLEWERVSDMRGGTSDMGEAARLFQRILDGDPMMSPSGSQIVAQGARIEDVQQQKKGQEHC